MTERSALHDTFRIDRHFDAAPTRVFRAFADKDAKAKWFAGPADTKREEFDFREGGRETMESVLGDGTSFAFAATYTDIVPGERIVYVYEMRSNGTKISASLATLEFKPTTGGTRLTLTEQGAFLDGYDDAGSRERGTSELLDRVGKSLG